MLLRVLQHPPLGHPKSPQIQAFHPALCAGEEPSAQLHLGAAHLLILNAIIIIIIVIISSSRSATTEETRLKNRLTRKSNRAFHYWDK